jgi:poly(hydroxyalkanoate) depolymerase family esterase
VLNATDKGKRMVLQRADAATAIADNYSLARVARFGSNPGNLGMFKYVPDGLPESAPLVVLLHGCGQTAAQFNEGTGWSALADRWGFALVMPEQRRDNNRQGCFNWFRAEHTERGQGEAMSIRQMVEWMHIEHATNPRRTFITGLSAGGAMTAVMLATWPELFAGGAIIAGVPYRAATSIPGALDAMYRGRRHPAQVWGDRVRAASGHNGPWPRVSIWSGNADTVVQPGNAIELVKQWTDVHGIDPNSGVEDRIDGYPRLVFRDAHGEDVVELITIDGLAHGVPIDPDHGGAVGPFILSAGISSPLRIAEFWGLDRLPEAIPAEEPEILELSEALDHPDETPVLEPVPESEIQPVAALESDTISTEPSPAEPQAAEPSPAEPVALDTVRKPGRLRRLFTKIGRLFGR